MVPYASVLARVMSMGSEHRSCTPMLSVRCPVGEVPFDLISVTGAASARPAFKHADSEEGLRGSGKGK